MKYPLLTSRKGYPDYEIADGRPANRFSGEVSEPRPNTRSGNIPNSKNVFFRDLVNEDWTFKTKPELEEIFKKSGVDVSKEVITMCGSGLTASMINVALHIVGKNQLRLYDGSWADYGRVQ